MAHSNIRLGQQQLPLETGCSTVGCFRGAVAVVDQQGWLGLATDPETQTLQLEAAVDRWELRCPSVRLQCRPWVQQGL